MNDRDNINSTGAQNADGSSTSTGNTSANAGPAGGPQRLSDSDDGATTPSPAESLRLEAEKFKNDYLYLRAEFENFKKQTIKERSDLRKYGAERLVIDLLNILDIFETALSTEVTPESLANFRKGIDLTAAELRSVLGRHGVEEVKATGVPFDPSLHEALSSEETNEFPAGTITRVFKKPYKLFERVVRPGQVVVAKPKS
jgi:molecular chaperone GrpE